MPSLTMRAGARHARRATRTLILSILASATGCAPAADPQDATDDGLREFSVSSGPTLVIDDDGTPERAFSRLSVRRLPDGTIAAADHGTLEIRIFDRHGRAVRQLARRGEGPGDLRGDFGFASHEDTLFVFGRPPLSPPGVDVFTAERFLSRIPPHRLGGGSRSVILARLTSGHYVIDREGIITIVTASPVLGVLVADSVTFGLVQAADHSSSAEPVWLTPVVRHWRHAYPWRGSTVGNASRAYGFRLGTGTVTSGDRLWLADPDSGVLRAFDGDGREVAGGRLSITPQPFDHAQLDRLRARDLAAAARELDTARVLSLYDPKILPATMPIYSSLYAGADGEIWIQLFDLDRSARKRFTVVDRQGYEIARATLPSDLDLQHIGADFVLGIRRDSLGIESVVEYALQR